MVCLDIISSQSSFTCCKKAAVYFTRTSSSFFIVYYLCDSDLILQYISYRNNSIFITASQINIRVMKLNAIQHKEMTFSYKYFFLWESSQGGLAPENSSANTFVERNDQHNKTSSLPITKIEACTARTETWRWRIRRATRQWSRKRETEVETIATIHDSASCLPAYIYIIHSFVFLDAKPHFRALPFFESGKNYN